ncbi:MAG TPA: RtcB family protein, partial [Chitinophagaceae bacterium]|nr:RtcB family protein [Chitinophagaceae bacterium]
SMTAPGFIVKGKGEMAAVNSASHGAGRKMSRTRAMEAVSDKQFKEEVEKHGVKLLGGGKDESPFAYKDIEEVMQSQKALVDVVGKFTPKIVKMDGAKHRSWSKKNQREKLTGDEV